MPYAEGVTVITATGGRPEAFELCAKYVSRQTCKPPIQWIVVNDVGLIDEQTRTYRDGSEMVWLSPSPPWQHGQNTLARNLLAAIPHVRYDRVVFVEDDDWIEDGYIEEMAAMLSGDSSPKIIGDPKAFYYHIPSRRYRIMKAQRHASLGQTAMRSEILAMLIRACKDSPDCIDVNLWGYFAYPVDREIAWLYDDDGPAHVSMKGLPGRPGIGIGHHPERNPELWKPDPDMSVLRSWIGEDVAAYERFSR